MTDAGSRDRDPLRGAWDRCRAALAWVLLFSAGVNLLYLAPSLYMMQVYDRVLANGSLETLLLLSLVLVLALLSLVALDMLRARIMARIALRLDHLLSPSLLLIGLRGDAGDRPQILREFDSVRQAIAGPGLMAAMDLCWAPLFLIVAFLIHPWIGVLAVCGGCGLLAIAIANERALRHGLAEMGALAPRLYAAQDAERTGGEAIRALGMAPVLLVRQRAARGGLNAIQTRTAFRSMAYSAATKFWRLALQSATLGLGAWLALRQQISPGALIAASILVSRAVAPIEQIVGSWRQIGQARGSWRVVAEALRYAPAEAARTILPEPRGRLSMEQVSIRAPNGDHLALGNIGFVAPPGEILGIVGPSGAGKSTLARLAAGAIAPDTGTVRLDGANLRDWEQHLLGRHIGYLPQDVALLAGTIAENIRRFETRLPGDAMAIDAAMIAASIAAGAHEMIQRLPQGYDTPLGPRGSGLSFGQAQRVALARALYRDPALIILDEPNAHLDSDGEVALAAALDAARERGASILIVAHRAGVLTRVDRLLVLREGRMEMIGPRDEVMRRLAAPRAPDGANPVAPLRAGAGQA